MKVKELIEKLQKLNQDYEIFINLGGLNEIGYIDIDWPDSVQLKLNKEKNENPHYTVEIP